MVLSSLHVQIINGIDSIMVSVFTLSVIDPISVIFWWLVLMVEETRVPRENHRPTASHRQILLHNVVSSTHRMSRIRNQNVSGDRH